MIVPGSVNPLLLAMFGDPLDELGKIERALRFRSSAGGKLNKTFAAAGNRKTWTLHVWAKRTKIQGAGSAIPNAFLLGSGTGVQEYSYCGFGNNWNASGDNIQMVFVTGNAEVGALKTSRQMRDVGGYVPLTFVADTTNATAGDRLRLYVEDVRETSFSTATYPAQNTDLPHINTTTPQGIGELVAAAGYTFEGYMGFFCFVDGQALAPTAFGLRHTRTGQWRPKGKAAIKAVADAGGANSYFLPFDDPTNLTTLCADASAKGNNWTASNISLTAGTTYDSSLDTPTNNFCVLNGLDKATEITLSNGALEILHNSSTVEWRKIRGTMELPKTGKWEWQTVATSVPKGTYSGGIGIASAANNVSVPSDMGNMIAYHDNGTKYVNGVNTAYGAAYVAGDRITVLYDGDANTIEFKKNGVSQGVISIPDTATKFPISASYGNTYAFDFGQIALVSPTAGYKTLCAKNLPKPGAAVQKSESNFVARTDTGANIVATLSAAALWNSWIRIYKRRDAAEGWRWQFSDDAANYLDSSGTAAKAAFPALAGTSYVGYALRIGPQYGAATGRLNHVNGVADVVADGLAKTRKLIILRNEAGGSWYVYHPELTAGKLLYLEQSAAETTDATISAVTSSGFTVAAALATGTYRWIALAETDGFLKLGKHAGNNSADGPCVALGQQTALFLAKAISTTPGGNDWYLFDSIPGSGNVITGADLEPNLTSGEGVSKPSYAMDFNGGCIKLRSASDGINYTSGYQYAYVSITAINPRYTNAR